MRGDTLAVDSRLPAVALLVGHHADEAHQKHLATNLFGFRCHANTGMSFPADTPGDAW